MKKKIFNDIRIIIILLIGVIILFAILGTFQLLPDKVNISNKEGMSDDNAPPCYSSVQDDEWASYNEDNKDNYILKTKIVPPKGTACPTEISSPASNYLNQITSSSKSNTSTSSSSNTNINTTTPTDTPTPTNISAAGSNTSTSNSIIPSNSSDSKKNEKNDSCPPCPACERCPEPAFDCKKVPNYRSPSIGQYLPMPILNDFSTF